MASRRCEWCIGVYEYEVSMCVQPNAMRAMRALLPACGPQCRRGGGVQHGTPIVHCSHDGHKQSIHPPAPKRPEQPPTAHFSLLHGLLQQLLYSLITSCCLSCIAKLYPCHPRGSPRQQRLVRRLWSERACKMGASRSNRYPSDGRHGPGMVLPSYTCACRSFVSRSTRYLSKVHMHCPPQSVGVRLGDGQSLAILRDPPAVRPRTDAHFAALYLTFQVQRRPAFIASPPLVRLWSSSSVRPPVRHTHCSHRAAYPYTSPTTLDPTVPFDIASLPTPRFQTPHRVPPRVDFLEPSLAALSWPLVDNLQRRHTTMAAYLSAGNYTSLNRGNPLAFYNVRRELDRVSEAKPTELKPEDRTLLLEAIFDDLRPGGVWAQWPEHSELLLVSCIS